MKSIGPAGSGTAVLELQETDHVSLDIIGIARLLTGPLAAFVFWNLSLGLEPNVHKVFAIVLFMIVYWIVEPIPHAVTALVGCYLFWALGVVKISVAFSGFASSTPWFVFACLLMGEAASKTNLVQRLGYWIMLHLGTSYSRLLLGIITVSFLLNFLIPNAVARVSMLAPIAIGILGAYGLGKQSRAGKGMFLILTYSCPLFAKMMMSGPAAIFTRGVIEEQTGVQIFWSQWLFAFLPVVVVTILASWILVRWIYPAEVHELPGGKEYLRQALRDMGSLKADEKKVLGWLLFATALWSTDSMHHISPAIITVGVGLALCFPNFGVLDEKAIKRINFMNVFFTAGALSMGIVLVETQALPALTDNIGDWITPFLSNSFSAAATLYSTGILYHLILGNDQSFLSTSLPVLVHIVQTHGYNPAVLGLVWAFTGGANLFMYQSAPLVLGYSYGYFTAKDLFKLALTLVILEGFLLALVMYFYWPLIGLSWIK